METTIVETVNKEGEIQIKFFWTNTIWFILLGISTIIELIYMLARVKKRKLALALFFTVSGMTFTFEVTIFCLLKSYNYFPMIIQNSLFDDGLAGNLFSQFSVSATAMLIAVLNLNFHWILIFAGIYGAIEELFIVLGIYKHYWYQTWMTIVGLIILFLIVKWMNKQSLKGFKSIWKYIYIMFGLYTLHMPTVIWWGKLTGIQTFNMKVLPDPVSSYSLCAVLNLLFLSVISMSLYFSKIKHIMKAASFLGLYAVYYIAYKLNFIIIKNGWFLIFITINIFSMYFYVFILDKLYGEAAVKKRVV